MAAVTESIDASLWNALRCIEESVMLLNHMGNHLVNKSQTNLAAIYFKEALEAEERGNIVRETIAKHDRPSRDRSYEASETTPLSESKEL